MNLTKRSKKTVNVKKISSGILAVLTILSLSVFTGCADNSKSVDDTSLPDTTQTADTDISGTGFQKNMNNGNYGKYISCETDEGYYFLLSNYICYTEKSNMNTTILCNKPECKHNTSDCNAYLDGATSLTYYNRNIYYDVFDDSKGVYYLYKMNTDGTDRKKVQSIYNASGSSFFTPKYIIDNGMVYIKINELSQAATATENIKLYAAPVGTDFDGAVQIDSLGNVEFDKMWADNGKLYYMVTVDGSDKLYSYDNNSSKKDLVWTVPSVSEVGSWASEGVGANGWYVKDNCLYFFLSGNGMYKYDFTAMKNECIKKITDSSHKGIASFDDNYMYINCSNPVVGSGKNQICIYDLSGNYIGTVTYDDILTSGDGYNEINVLCTSNGNLFVIGDSMLTNSQGYEYGIEDVFYIPLADINGNTFKKLEFNLTDYVVKNNNDGQ